MISLSELRNLDVKVICLGSHPGIIQSMLDYDFLIGKKEPSILAIVASNRKQERYFWGESEVIVPVAASLDKIPANMRERTTAVLNVQSARRVLASTTQALQKLPNLRVVTVFAEQTP